MVQAVLFDIGATLINGPSSSPIRQVCQILNLDKLARDQVSRLIMGQDFPNEQSLIQELGRFYPISTFQAQQIAELWFSQANSTWEVPGATALVRSLKQQGWKIGLVSNIWSPYYQSFQQTCPEINQMVDWAALSFREGHLKPSPQLLQTALANLPADNYWMVGDTYENDLKPAIDLRLKTVWVLSRPEKEAGAMRKVLTGEWPRPDLIVDSLQKIQIIKR